MCTASAWEFFMNPHSAPNSSIGIGRIFKQCELKILKILVYPGFSIP